MHGFICTVLYVLPCTVYVYTYVVYPQSPVLNKLTYTYDIDFNTQPSNKL